MNEDLKNIAKETAQHIKDGKVILYPTDTIWGLGCDATNEKAVQRIYEIKKRTDEKKMLLLIDTDAKLPGLVDQVPDIAYNLIDVAVNPLTIIYPNGKNVAPSLLSPEKTIGIRITKEAFSHLLCQMARVPIVSTSANISGTPFPSCFSEISEEIKNAVDYIVPIYQNRKDKMQPSEIIALGTSGEVKVIR